MAVESSLSEPVAQSLHAAVLQALEHDPPQPVSTARRVHHATRAGDVAAVLRLAPEAARQAEARGAHREAAAHWRTALDHAREHALPDAERAAWLDASARECQSIDQLDEAIAARLELDALHARAGHIAEQAHNLSLLALVFVLALRNDDADAASRRGVALLETLPPGAALAGAYRVEAQLRMLNRDYEAAIAWGDSSIALAEPSACARCWPLPSARAARRPCFSTTRPVVLRCSARSTSHWPTGCISSPPTSTTTSARDRASCFGCARRRPT